MLMWRCYWIFFAFRQLGGLHSYFHGAKSTFSLCIIGAKQSLLWWICAVFAGVPSASKQRVQLCGICFLGFSVDLADLLRHWPFLYLLWYTALLILTHPGSTYSNPSVTNIILLYFLNSSHVEDVFTKILQKKEKEIHYLAWLAFEVYELIITLTFS